jgi:hypothetical protein
VKLSGHFAVFDRWAEIDSAFEGVTSWRTNMGRHFASKRFGRTSSTGRKRRRTIPRGCLSERSKRQKSWNLDLSLSARVATQRRVSGRRTSASRRFIPGVSRSSIAVSAVVRCLRRCVDYAKRHGRAQRRRVSCAFSSAAARSRSPGSQVSRDSSSDRVGSSPMAHPARNGPRNGEPIRRNTSPSSTGPRRRFPTRKPLLRRSR